MALTSLLKTFRVPFNANNEEIADQFNAFFSANSNIIIKSMDCNSLDSTYGSDDLTLRVAYQEVSGEDTGILYTATVYTESGSTTAQQAFNDDHSVNNICQVPLLFKDITDQHKNHTSPQQILVIAGNTSAAGDETLFALDRGVFVAQPNADIAAGATDLATIINACGAVVSSSFPITNVDPATIWPMGQRNYVVFDPVTGELIGLPSCCGNSPLGTPVDPTTTTTGICIEVEVPSFTPETFTCSTTVPPKS
jgi:hypothetical protein